MSEKIVGTQECSLQRVINTLRSQNDDDAFSAFRNNWFGFAMYLRTPGNVIHIIRQNLILHPNSMAECIYDIIGDWVARNGSEAKLEILKNALILNGLTTLADRLEKEFGDNIRKHQHPKNRKYCKLSPLLQANVDRLISSKSFGVISSMDVSITSQKLRDNLPSANFYKFNEFLKMRCCSANDNFVHIVGNVPKQNIGSFVAEVKRNDYAIAGTIIIIIPEEYAESIFQLLRPHEIFRDEMAWGDLSPQFKQTLRSKLKLQKINIESTKEEEVLSGRALVDVIKNNELKFLTKSVPTTISYYVKRTVISRHILSRKYLFGEDPSSPAAIFVFTGINRPELGDLVGNQTTDNSSNLIHQFQIKPKYIVLDHPNHFQRICERTRKPVHGITYKNGRFLLTNSNGSMASVQSLIDKSQDYVGEDELIEYLTLSGQSNKPVCISDSPGMGKSTLLANIGNKLKQSYPTRAVLFLRFSQLINAHNREPTSIVNLLIDLTCQNKLQKLILSEKLNSESIQIELLLDGLDEVNSAVFKSAVECLLILKSLNSIRLWITTRPHLLCELEETVNVLGYNIRAFTEEDQIKFLKSYWTTSYTGKDDDLDTTKLQQFARRCLSSLKSTLNAEDEDIAGIPLQCLLIGQVFEEDAIESSQFNFNHSINVEIESVSSLYQKLVQQKLKTYQEKFVSDMKLSENEIFDSHIQLALQLVFPEQKRKRLSSLFPTPIFLEEVLNVGILEKSSTMSDPKFIHRTFAEFFVAWFSINVIIKKEEEGDEVNEVALRNRVAFFQELMLCHHHCIRISKDEIIKSYKFVHPTIIYFINAMIGCNGGGALDEKRMHSPILTQGFTRSYQTMYEIAHACANDRLFHLFQLFENLQGFLWHMEIFDENFIFLAVRHSSLDFVEVAFSRFRLRDLAFDERMQNKSLQLAVAGGNVSVLEYLINVEQLRTLIENPNGESQYLLHNCVKESSTDSDLVIRHKIEILRLILRINKSLLETLNEEEKTPILSPSIHILLINELISFEVNIMAKDKYRNTILHNMSSSSNSTTSSHYCQLLNSIPSIKLKKLLQLKNSIGDTPLMALIRSHDPLPEILEEFRRNNANFNSYDKNWYSVLAVAIISGRNATTIRKIIKCGANVWWTKGWQGKTLLHYAAEYGNVDAMRLLVKDEKMDMSMKDWSWYTPLHYLMAIIGNDDDDGYNNNGEDFKQSFNSSLMELNCHQQQQQLNSTIQEPRQTIFHAAVLKKNLKAVRLLLDLGLNVNSANDQGNTPLHLAMMDDTEESLPLIRLMLYYGAKQDILNKDSMAPFHLAWDSNGFNAEKLRLLLLTGINVSLPLGGKDSSFQFALKSKSINFEMFQILREAHQAILSRCEATDVAKFLLKNEKDVDDSEFYSIVRDCCNYKESLDATDDAESGDSLLGVAIKRSFDLTVNYLISKGIEIDKINNNGDSALHISINALQPNHDSSIIKALINAGADAYKLNGQNQTFLHLLLEKLQILPLPNLLWGKALFDELMEFLLVEKNYSRLFEVPGGVDGTAPVHLTVQWRNVDVKLLNILSAAGVNFNVLDNGGKSVLFYAISGKHDIEFLSALVRFGADPFHLDNLGSSVLHYAVQLSSREVLGFLILLGIDVNGVDRNGDTPLHCALWQDHKDTILDKIKLLVQSGADVNIANNQRSNLLHYAAQLKDAELLEYFVQAGIDLDDVDLDGNTPLHNVVLQSDNVMLTKKKASTIIKAGANVNVKNKEGFTPLELALNWTSQVADQNLKELLGMNVENAFRILVDELLRHQSIADSPHINEDISE